MHWLSQVPKQIGDPFGIQAGFLFYHIRIPEHILGDFRFMSDICHSLPDGSCHTDNPFLLRGVINDYP
jgi:hypothetical protein